jgi:hypothetical protein
MAMMVWRYQFAAAADIVSFKTLVSAVSSDLSPGLKACARVFVKNLQP